jgi:hypothetical protein
MPDAPGSGDVLVLLGEFDKVAAEFLGFKLADEAGEIHGMTANVKRKIRQLLTHAYAVFRKRGDEKLTMDHVKAAFKAPQFSVMREDVEAIFLQAITGKPVPGRADLWCPFGVEFNIVPSTIKAITRDREKQAQAELLRQSMTNQERKRHDASGEKKAVPSPRVGTGGAKVVKLPTRRELDAKKLLQNTLEHRDSPK